MTAEHAWRQLAFDDFDRLLDALRARGFRPVGPQEHDGALVLAELEAAAALPWGVRDEQGPGRYRLGPGDAGAFGHNATAGSWKTYLRPPERTLFTCGPDLVAREGAVDTGPFAFVGVRACDLAAMGILDRAVGAVDGAFRRTRDDALLVAVQCRTAAATCFCPSLGTGPELPPGADLELVELPDARSFRLRAGTERGAAILEALALPLADDDVEAQRTAQADAVRAAIGRRLDTQDLKARLQGAREAPGWDRVAQQCLACGNCTSVCPTCFCSKVEDRVDTAGTTAERVEAWDSCFHLDFTYVHDTHERTSVRARYRQWLTHKFAHWYDQFGTSGCVGCGRCIAWCPVGIDVTEVIPDVCGSPP
jgi:ferredoxin